MNSIYFVDFDNTISNQDVWDSLVRTFTPNGWKQVVGAYIRGEITSREGNLKVAEFFPPVEEQARELILSIGIDPTFRSFADWVERQGYPMMVLSDGYDYYIQLLFEQAGLQDLPVFCNKLVWCDSGIQVKFPYRNKQCVRDMAHCKCQHIHKNEGMRRVYIGDGISDTCAAAYCEQIYAKADLEVYCREHQIAHTGFRNFEEIIEQEEALLQELTMQED